MFPLLLTRTWNFNPVTPPSKQGSLHLTLCMCVSLCVCSLSACIYGHRKAAVITLATKTSSSLPVIHQFSSWNRQAKRQKEIEMKRGAGWERERGWGWNETSGGGCGFGWGLVFRLICRETGFILSQTCLLICLPNQPPWFFPNGSRTHWHRRPSLRNPPSSALIYPLPLSVCICSSSVNDSSCHCCFASLQGWEARARKSSPSPCNTSLMVSPLRAMGGCNLCAAHSSTVCAL